jgi:hypothetical protein
VTQTTLLAELGAIARSRVTDVLGLKDGDLAHSPQTNPPRGASFSHDVEFTPHILYVKELMTPLVTVTPRLEQEFGFDFFDQQNGGALRATTTTSSIGAAAKASRSSPHTIPRSFSASLRMSTSPKGVETDAFGDYPIFLGKYRFISANEENGNYIVTGFFQIAQPLGNNAVGTSDKITNNVLVLASGHE